MSNQKYSETFSTARLSRLYQTWYDMHKRCKETAREADKTNYYDKGIRVCAAWVNWPGFASWALKSGYSDGREIDRIDANLGYSPDNCRWLTSGEHHRRTYARPFVCVERRYVFFNHVEAAEKMGLNRVSITNALSGKHKTCGGFHWEYLPIIGGAHQMCVTN